MKFRYLITAQIRALLFLALLSSQLTLQAQDDGPSYIVDLGDAKNHYVTVTMSAFSQGETTEIMMPTWTPGSYLVREYARHIDQIEVTDTRGRALPFEKISKNRWRINTKGKREFEVTYRVFCFEKSVRTNWVGESYAVLNGAPTFLTVPEQMALPHTISLHLPEGWKKSATSLESVGNFAHDFIAKNYDEVVDSPIVAGDLEIFPFRVAGIEHQLVNVNDIGYWDGASAARDLARIVKEHQKLWDVVPYERYLFLNVLGDGGGGGLEHDNCCLIMASHWGFRDYGRYKSWLSLASHEFFHTWNVRRLRPKALVEYDYENENYTPSLWVAEGITSYYQSLLLARAELIGQGEFIAMMSGYIRRVQSNPGRYVQSLRDSSHDAWVKFYRDARNSGNTQVSYYTKGAVVACLLDAKIRLASEGTRSLDDVLRYLYKHHSGDIGYTPEEFREICSNMAGEDLTEWFRVAVDSAEELDYQSLADSYGVSIGGFIPGKKNENNAGSNQRQQAWLGVSTSSSSGQLLVTSVSANSPASEVGLGYDDEIIAIDGVRVRSNLESRLNQYEIGDEITLMISREGKIIELPIVIGARTVESWVIRTYRSATDEQKARKKAWLSESAPKEVSPVPFFSFWLRQQKAAKNTAKE